jgi:CysZ protein
MIEAAFKAFSQMLTPPFRRILLKAVGLAVLFIILIGVSLQRLVAWLATAGAAWSEATIGYGPHAVWETLVWILSIAAGLGIVTGAIFLMPAVTAFVGSFFADEIAEHVEREHYPAEPPGKPLPLVRATLEGLKTALFSIAVYLIALPFVLFAGLGLFILFFATAYLLSREYFELVAMRFMPPAEAKALRRAHRVTVFVSGLAIAAFVSIPIVNLATPLFATAFMVHIYKRVSGRRIELIEPKRASSQA